VNVKYRGPVLVPSEHRGEIAKLSKAALMDMVWDLCGESFKQPDNADVMIKFRQNWKVVELHRKHPDREVSK
jgi:hypothetical protein